MYYLVALIVAISLGGLYFFGFSGSVNERPFLVDHYKYEIKNKFLLLQQGYINHLNYNYESPTTLNWENELSEYISIPTSIKDLSWSYDENSGNEYFCLSGNLKSDIIYDALFEAKKEYSPNKFFVNSNCGALSDFASEPSFSTNPKVSATYYIN
tara:strand:+ start:46055 stop:46519 length:465 start_codon:yes stop_codon:yes gene_type:complete